MFGFYFLGGALALIPVTVYLGIKLGKYRILAPIIAVFLYLAIPIITPFIILFIAMGYNSDGKHTGLVGEVINGVKVKMDNKKR